MAKPAPKSPARPENATDAAKADTETAPKAVPETASTATIDKPEPSVSSSSVTRKESVPPRPKKQVSTPSKSGSLLPSAHKLEHLKAAISAAGNADQLLTILRHVEEAGGIVEVTESIDAYKVLKTIVETDKDA